MSLAIRMILYALSAFGAGYGFATFDPIAGTVTINIQQAAALIGGGGVFGATFLFSRYAKDWGWKT